MKNVLLTITILMGILMMNVVYAVPVASNQANITAKVLDVDLVEIAGSEASKFQLKIIKSENVEDYLNFAKVNETIEAIIYHKNTPNVSSILEVGKGDIITGIVFYTGDEGGGYWQARDIKIIEQGKVEGKNNTTLYIIVGIIGILILGIVFWKLRNQIFTPNSPNRSLARSRASWCSFRNLAINSAASALHFPQVRLPSLHSLYTSAICLSSSSRWNSSNS